MQRGRYLRSESKEARDDALLKDLLDIALAHWSQIGAPALSVARLVKKQHCARASFYAHFKDIDDFSRYAREQFADRLSTKLRRAVGRSAQEGIENLSEDLSTWITDFPQLSLLLAFGPTTFRDFGTSYLAEEILRQLRIPLQHSTLPQSDWDPSFRVSARALVEQLGLEAQRILLKNSFHHPVEPPLPKTAPQKSATPPPLESQERQALIRRIRELLSRLLKG